MIRRPPRSTQSRSSAASDVYKRQVYHTPLGRFSKIDCPKTTRASIPIDTSSESSRRDVSNASLLGIDTIPTAVETSTMENRPRGVRYSPSCTVLFRSPTLPFPIVTLVLVAINPQPFVCLNWRRGTFLLLLVADTAVHVPERSPTFILTSKYLLFFPLSNVFLAGEKPTRSVPAL